MDYKDMWSLWQVPMKDSQCRLVEFWSMAEYAAENDTPFWKTAPGMVQIPERDEEPGTEVPSGTVATTVFCGLVSIRSTML